MKTIFTILVATLLMLNFAFAQNVGDPAPDFTLKDLNESNYTLSSDKGKVVFIFFIGNACPNCIASSPTVKSVILDEFNNNNKFHALVIDTWDGSASAVLNYKNSTNLNATFLQKGGTVANNWRITYDRLAVVDAEGKIVFKGSTVASSDAALAKSAIQTALNNLTTSVNDIDFSEGFQLEQNYPNPFQNKTIIKFSIPKAAEVSLSVFDIAGKKRIVPVQQYYQAGQYEVPIFGKQLKPGMYFYELKTGGFSAIKKMIVQ